MARTGGTGHRQRSSTPIASAALGTGYRKTGARPARSTSPLTELPLDLHHQVTAQRYANDTLRGAFCDITTLHGTCRAMLPAKPQASDSALTWRYAPRARLLAAINGLPLKAGRQLAAWGDS